MLKPSVGLIVSMSSPLNFFLRGGSGGARRGGAGRGGAAVCVRVRVLWRRWYYFFETTAASWRVESAGKDSQDGRLPGVVQAKNEDPDLPLLRLELLEDGEKTHGAAQGRF